MFALFNLSIFISAFLLFLIQPMTANILLPKVGGSPNIWNACTVFFQISLLAGYLYSYVLSGRFSLKRQIVIHCLLLFVALFAVRFQFQTDIIDVNRPAAGVLKSLLKNIFFPFVLLSTTSPLIQRWLSLSDLKERKNPYSLYVCSNIGSLAALYIYPLAIEKIFGIKSQGVLWHFLFGCFFCTVLGIAFYLNKTTFQTDEISKNKTIPKIDAVSVFYWILLAFIPSSLMLRVTNHLSTDIGGLPFLWILPLSLYLFSFILTFSKFYTPDAAGIFRRLYKTAVVLVIIFFFHFKILSSARDNLFLIFSHCLFYFIFSVYCHGLLSVRKPAPEKLTLFYLCLAVGGALGGVFNTFAAPYLFLSFMEYPFILAASLPFVLSSFSKDKKDLIKNILLSAAAVLLFVFVPNFSAAVEKKLQNLPEIKIGIDLLLAAAGFFFIFSKKKNLPLFFSFLVLFLLLHSGRTAEAVFQKRNFFGTLAVKKIASGNPFLPSFIVLEHGDTFHGVQKVRILPEKIIYSYDPDAYYGPQSAIKDFFKIFKRPSPAVIAWLGLGSGATICYAPPQTRHDIFEIDRDIVEISTKHRYFRYLEHCAPSADIKIGDARIEIGKQTNQKYDLIVIDVFSSHFIPVHLTTEEAVETYRSKLKPGGLILFHISSRAFNVEPVLAKIAAELKMVFIVRYLPPYDRDYPQWGVLSDNPQSPEIKALLSMPGWKTVKAKQDSPLWTDDFHNLLSALRR